MTAADPVAGLEALEFATVLDVIAGHAAGELAAARIRDLRPHDDLSRIHDDLARVGELLALLRRADAPEVPAVPDLRGALARLRVDGGVLELGDLLAIRRTLTAGRTIATELERVAEWAPRLAMLGAPPPDRAVERRMERAVNDDGELLDSASPALAVARREVHVARERLIRRLEAILRDVEPSAGGSVTVRGGRYVIPVRRDARSRPEGIIHDESGSSGTLFIEPSAAIELGNALRSAIIDEERAVLAVLRELTAVLQPERNALAAMHAMAVEVDTLMARARWAFACDAEVPTVSPVGGELRLNRARHPLLLARGIDAVPFDLHFEGAERTLLISGPNTGGKTVLLKTAGLAIALAQSGVVPPLGAGSVVPMVTAVMVDIGDHQSIAADLSTFSAHVAALRALLDHADHGTLVILDEMGSGTDPSEGGALATAVLEELTRRGALTLATTHLGALKSLAARIPGVVNGSLQFDAATLSPTYRFTKGVPGRSYGLAIARRLGVDAGVLAAAEALVPETERELDRLLAVVESREQELAEREQVAAERLAELELREARARATAEDQAAREREIERQEREGARERGRAAKAYLLEARKRVEEALALAKGAADEAAAREARRLVEEGIRAERDALSEDADEPAGGGHELAVGGSVRLATGAVGEVAELRPDGRAVVQVGAMRLVVKRATLTPVAGKARRSVVAEPRSDPVAREANWEIDLRGLRVDDALIELNAALDGAVLAEQPFLRIIHGMGTGAVRDAVQRTLAADRRVAGHEFASRAQGGTGVTVARFR